MVRSILMAFCAFSLPSTAFADTTAVYSFAGGEMTMTVEIAANGDLRAEMGGKMLEEMLAKLPADVRADWPKGVPGFIMRNGEGYFLQPASAKGGVAVVPIKEATVVMADAFRRSASGESEVKAAEEPKLSKGGSVSVNGRSGTAYYSESRKGEKPVVVISTDPELTELAHGLNAQFEMSLAMGGQVGFPKSGGEIGTVLKSGAPLRLAGMELTELRRDPISPDRFVLPATPLTRAEVRSLFERGAGKP